jgi:hypothetical protein
MVMGQRMLQEMQSSFVFVRMRVAAGQQRWSANTLNEKKGAE